MAQAKAIILSDYLAHLYIKNPFSSLKKISFLNLKFQNEWVNFSSRSIDQWVLGLEEIIAMFTSKSLHSSYEVTKFKDNIYLRHMFTYYTHTNIQTPHSYIDMAKIKISEYYLPQFCVLFPSYSYLITKYISILKMWISYWYY